MVLGQYGEDKGCRARGEVVEVVEGEWSQDKGEEQWGENSGEAIA